MPVPPDPHDPVRNLFHSEPKTQAPDRSSNSSPRKSESASWNWPDPEEEVFHDEMNIDLGEYDIDETGLDAAPSESEGSESNGKRRIQTG